MEGYDKEEARKILRKARVERIRRRRRNTKIINTIGLVLLIIVILVGYWYINGIPATQEVEEVDASQGIEVEVAIEEVEPERISVTITAVGDCTLGTDESYGLSGSFVEMYNKQGPEYFFKEVKSIFEADDITLINLENPLTTNLSGRADKQFAFRGEPEYVKIMSSSSVEAANIANNHSKDYGWAGYEDTKQALNDGAVEYFGYDNIAYFEKEGIKVALIGVYQLSLGESAKQEVELRVAEAIDAGSDLIITSFHWGVESTYEPTSLQVSLAKAAIDAGSDVVLGHHPHVLQSVEEYNGKYIFYSLGNFSFGGNRNPSDFDTMIYQHTFTFEDKELVEDDLNIIPCRVSSVNGYNNFQPKVATGEEKETIVKKLNDLSDIDITQFVK